MELVLLTHVSCVQHLVWSNPSEEHWLWFNAVGIYLYCESISKYYALLLVSTSYMIKNHWFLLFLCYGKMYSIDLCCIPNQSFKSLVLFFICSNKTLGWASHKFEPLAAARFGCFKIKLTYSFLGQLCGSLAVFYLMFCWCTIWYLPYSEMFNHTCWCSYYMIFY